MDPNDAQSFRAGVSPTKISKNNDQQANVDLSSLLLHSRSLLQIQWRNIPITTILIPIPIPTIPLPPNKTNPPKPPAPPQRPLPNTNKRGSLQKSPSVTRPPPRLAVPMIMMEQPPHVTGGGLLGSSRHVRAQLRGQNRNVRASAFVFDKDRLEVVEFVFGDLRVGGEDLLGGGAELQVA